ncbi:MAG: hypothetical protein ACR2H6_00405 [Pyrinomonadaceae bacterium]
MKLALAHEEELPTPIASRTIKVKIDITFGQLRPSLVWQIVHKGLSDEA